MHDAALDPTEVDHPPVGAVLEAELRRAGGSGVRVLGIVRERATDQAALSSPELEIVDWAEARAAPLFWDTGDTGDTLVMILDEGARVSWANAGLERITGWSAADVVGSPLARVLQQLGLNIDEAEVARTIASGDGWSADLRMTTRRGELRHLRTSVSAIVAEAGPILGALITARDETELQRLRSVAEAVNLATNLGQMFAGIRHELGNPVNSLKTALTVLSKSWDRFEPDHVDHYFERMLLEVGRMEYLLRSLRSFSAFEDLSLQRVCVEAVLDEISKLSARSAADRGIALRVEATPGLAVAADERGLCQILLNLVTNAMDAVASPGGTIALRSRRLGAGVAAIEVIDDGEGIPFERIEAIRRPFFTTKAHGTGLGLTIVDRLAAEMNGELVIESCPGRTAMRVLLEEHQGDG